MRNVLQEVVKFKGIVKDIPPMELMEVPVWTEGRNVHFDDGSTHRVGGYGRMADALPAGAEPVFLHPVLTPDAAYWMYVSDDGITVTIYVTDGSTHYDITPAAGLTTGGVGIWTGTTLNGLPCLNNSIDVPFWWDGDTGNVCQPLPDWPATTRAGSIRAYKYFLVAVNLVIDGVAVPNMIMWSDAADPNSVPGSWTPLPSNSAGDNILAEELGGIVDCEVLRDQLIIYRQHSTATCSYVAGQYVFVFRELFNTSGIQALNCAQEVRGHHYVITDDDIIMHDGNTFKTIVDNILRRFIFAGISPELQSICCTAVRTSIDEVWFAFPSVDSTLLDIVAIYSLEDKVFGIREVPDVAHIKTGIIPDDDYDNTWDESLYIWQEDPRFWGEANYSITNDGLLMADPAVARLLHVDKLHSNDGEPVVAFVERTFHTLGGEQGIWSNCLTQDIWPNITGSDGNKLQIRIGAAQSPSHAIEWGPTVDYTIGEKPPHVPKIDSLVHGRFMCMRFSSTGGDPWQLHRVGIEYVELGKY